MHTQLIKDLWNVELLEGQNIRTKKNKKNTQMFLLRRKLERKQGTKKGKKEEKRKDERQNFPEQIKNK